MRATMAARRGVRRLSTLLSPVDDQTAMIVGRPFWRYPLAVAKPEPGMRPLMDAITALPLDRRPFRIVSHEAEDGRVFNSTFFESDAHASEFLEWCGRGTCACSVCGPPSFAHAHTSPACQFCPLQGPAADRKPCVLRKRPETMMGLPSARSPPGRYDTHALQPTGEFHRCLTGAIAPGTQLPTGATLLFGRGGGVLDDTRFGEYQLGMAVRYSLASFRSAKEERQAAISGTSAAFEQRIADAMAREGIAYFGRLVMRVRSRPLPPAGAPPSFDSPLCAVE